MANVFTRADIISAWRFESGALATDEKAANTLTLVNTPTEDTTNMMEGSCCMDLDTASSEYAAITDSNLSAGFPLKSGDATKVITISCWIRPTTVDANKRVIWSKHKNETGKRCLALVHNSTQIYLRHNVTGTTVTDLSMGFGAMTANQKYFIMVSVDGIGRDGYPCYWFRIYNATAGTWFSQAGITAAGALSIGTADFRIGADDDLTANCYFDGQIDEVIVSNSRLHNSEAVAIQGGNFPVTGVWIYDYLYDPAMAADTYDGFSDVTKAYQTLKHYFLPGDIIYGKKSTETAQSGTATATNGSVSVTGISGWTPVAGDLLRFDSDDALYGVRAYDAGTATITLWRKYKGVTGSGKTVNKLTWSALAGSDYSFTSCSGKSTSRITIKGGVNFTNMTQEGWTCGDSANYYHYQSTVKYTDYSRIGLGGSSQGFHYKGANYFCTYESIYFYYCALNSSTGEYWSCEINNPMVEYVKTILWPGGYFYNCVLNDPDIGYEGQFYLLGGQDLTINNLLIGGTDGAVNTMSLGGIFRNVRFMNPVFTDQVDNIIRPCAIGGTFTGDDLVFVNPKITFPFPILYWGPPDYFRGNIRFVNINGNPNDNVTYHGLNTDSGYITEVPDYDVYKTAAPSVRLILSGIETKTTFFKRHYIPCEAGVEKTISAWIRKNSAPISAVTGDGNGSGYVKGDLIRVVQGSAGGSILKLVSVGAGGALGTLSLLRGGYLYSVANNLETAAITGVGTGGTVDITSIGTGYGSDNLPFMRLRWNTGTAPNVIENVHDVPMADVNDDFQQVSYAVTPSIKGVIIVEFHFKSANTFAECWYDSIGVV